MERLGSVGFASLAAAMLWGGAASAATPIYREIKDWIIACDNTRTCTAKFVTDDMSATSPIGNPGYLEITREPGGRGALALAIQSEDKTPDPSKLSLDGKPLAGSFPWRRDDGTATISLQGTDAARFIQAIRQGSLLTYSPGPDAMVVSLNGLSAVLLAMDEVQGRLGGQTALVRSGPAPASAVPPADPMPVVYAAPTKQPLANAPAFAAAVRRSQRALIQKHQCQPEMQRADEAYALNDSEAIVLIGCLQAAYQSSVLLFRAPKSDPAKARQVIFPPQPTVDPKLVDAQAGEYVAEGGWDPKTAAFTESAKGRGVADCGSSSTWVFDGQAFHLSEFNSQTRCGGDPGDWPTIWRTRVVTH